jgi:hypothetical protein
MTKAGTRTHALNISGCNSPVTECSPVYKLGTIIIQTFISFSMTHRVTAHEVFCSCLQLEMQQTTAHTDQAAASFLLRPTNIGKGGKEQIWNLFSMVQWAILLLFAVAQSFPIVNQLYEVGAVSLKSSYRMGDVACFAKNLRECLFRKAFLLTTSQIHLSRQYLIFKDGKSHKTRKIKEDSAL